MNIVIVGQGAMGLLWYHQLIKNAANDVSLLCSARITSAPTQSLFTDLNHQLHKQALTVATRNDLNIAELIIICVKSYQVPSVLKRISSVIAARASVIFSHNGMVNFAQLPPLTQNCYALLTTHGSKVIASFHAQHTGLGHSDLGLINGNAKLTEQHAVEQVLNKALPTVTLTQNIKEKQWLKLAINCVINPITAVHNIDNGQLLEDKYQPLIVSLITEIIAVAKQQGLALELDDINAQVLMVATKTASNCSSMRSDVLHQRQTEIGAINGYITNIANRAGIAVPENDKLIKQVKALES